MGYTNYISALINRLEANQEEFNGTYAHTGMLWITADIPPAFVAMRCCEGIICRHIY